MSDDFQDQRININVLGVDLTFRFQAGRERIDDAKQFIEKEFHKLRNRGKLFSDEQVLMMLLIVVADELLQSQQYIQDSQERVEKLLLCIDKAEKLTP